MSSYASFVQTCWEKHKKKHPNASVSFLEFSMDHVYKEKGKFEDMAKVDKAHCKRHENLSLL